MKKQSSKEVITDFNTIHNNYYDYSLVEYIGSGDKVKIICPIHNIFEQTPSKHKMGQGCPKCGSKKGGNNSHSINQILEDFTSVHGDLYDYSLVPNTYINGSTKVKIGCKEHGIFRQKPHAHKSGQGCPKCNTGGEGFCHGIETYRNRKTTLYYIKVDNLYKIGLTLKSVKSRYSQDKNVSISILKEWIFEDGSEAYKLEQSIINKFRKNKYFGKNILVSGNSELFETDIIQGIEPIITQTPYQVY